MSVSPYPHIKMGVRDESIFVGLDTENLPLDKPLYMSKCAKGPIGKPVWCPTYTYACQVFGTETFTKRSEYWSEQSYFLLKTLVSNGAFIMRVAEEAAKEAMVFVQCGIKKSDVPQWQRNTITGQFVLADDGSRIAINKNGEVCSTIEELDPEEDNGIYASSSDTKFVLGKKYYVRDYKKYNYTIFTGAKAPKDCVLYRGVLEPSAVPVAGSTTLRNQQYSDIEKEYTADEITEELIAKEYIFRKAVEGEYFPAAEFVSDTTYYTYDKYVEADISEFATGVTYFERTAPGKFVQTTGAFDASKTYYIYSQDDASYVGTGTITAFVDGVNYFTKAAVGDLILVEDFKNLDVSINYYTLGFTTFEGQIFKKNDPIEDAGVWYTRTPVYTMGYTHKLLNTDDGLIDELAAGDLIEADNNLYHLDTNGNYIYVGNYGQLYTKTGELQVGDTEPQATITGYQLVWRAVLRSSEYLNDGDVVQDSSTPGYDWYPMFSFEADSKGRWGNAFGFRFFYDKDNNTVAGTVQNGAVKYSLAPLELKSGDTTPTAIVDAYGESTVVGTIRDNVFDPTTELEITLKKLVPSKYSGSRELPCSMTIFPENFETIGRKIMEAEQEVKNEIKTLFADCFPKDEVTKQPVISTFVDDLLESAGSELADIEGAGHMANIVSCIAADKVPYFASYVVGSYDESTGESNPISSAIDMVSDSQFYLLGGTDGDISDAAIERYQRKHISEMIAGTQDYLVDYLRCPYNSLIDTGVSLQTKKAYLDFMGARDNLTVFLTPQQLWKNADGTTPEQLSRYEDESVGAILRSYGLLMREDVENQTEANRCIIFLASGINSDHDYANDGLCASTLWIALKNAEYYNGTKIKDEPVERPNSEITCYDGGMTWTAASEETRSRCWNAGLNYAQYCEQTKIHYASVRSIYRYDTSVLCDMGTVRAVTFCKDIIRREWAIWAGSKRKALELNSLITKALNDKCGTMLNNKYTATAKVYQTDEDKKYGYVRHVDLELESPAQNRVWLATIICKREGYDPATDSEAK